MTTICFLKQLKASVISVKEKHWLWAQPPTAVTCLETQLPLRLLGCLPFSETLWVKRGFLSGLDARSPYTFKKTCQFTYKRVLRIFGVHSEYWSIAIAPLNRISSDSTKSSMDPLPSCIPLPIPQHAFPHTKSMSCWTAVFWMSKSDVIPATLLWKVRAANGYWYFEVSHPTLTDVFSEYHSVLRTDASANCGQCAKLIFATAGDVYFYGSGCQNMKLTAAAGEERGSDCRGKEGVYH